MTYINKFISDKDEEILYFTKIHWVINIYGLIWFIAIITTAFFSKIYISELLGSYIKRINFDINGIYSINLLDCITIALIFIAFIILLGHVTTYIYSEIAITSKRIIYKKGFIMVKTEEIDISEIKAEHINQGIFGRFLNYGAINLDSKFVNDLLIPSIRAPYIFVQAIHKSRSAIIGRNNI